MKDVIKHIKNKLGEGNFLIKNKHDVYFITRFKSSNLLILLTKEKNYALTDQRYYLAAKNKLTEFEVIDLGNKNWIEKIKTETNLKTLNIDKNEHSISSFESLKKLFNEKEIEIVAKDFGYLRDIYLKEDLNHIKKAVKINDEIFSNIKSIIKEGMTEKEITKLIITQIINSEAEGPSFHPIVASGPSGANPHWEGSNKKIKKNEMITIDMGVIYKGFVSDMTRTFAISGKVSKEEEEIWNVVNEAMEKTIKEIEPGVRTDYLYNKAMEIIDSKGYGKYFTHGLGHGIGVEVHDYPNLSFKGSTELKSGMVITIEPGIYIPKKYGVRLEQDVLVTEDGYEVLNKSEISLY